MRVTNTSSCKPYTWHLPCCSWCLVFRGWTVCSSRQITYMYLGMASACFCVLCAWAMRCAQCCLGASSLHCRVHGIADGHTWRCGLEPAFVAFMQALQLLQHTSEVRPSWRDARTGPAVLQVTIAGHVDKCQLHSQSVSALCHCGRILKSVLCAPTQCQSYALTLTAGTAQAQPERHHNQSSHMTVWDRHINCTNKPRGRQ
jgi:hypothetical protein